MYCFADQGLTILDTCRELVWEKKDTAVGSGTDPSNLHDADNRYTWAGRCTFDPDRLCQPNAAAAATCALQSGDALGCAECGATDTPCNVDPSAQGAITTIWDWINQVNATIFGGYDDWRLPTSGSGFSEPTGDPAELELLVDRSQGECGDGIGPCIDPMFGPTDVFYATGSSVLFDSSFGAFVSFQDTPFRTIPLTKTQSAPIRAVRDVANPRVAITERRPE
jgi:hypothetical protein